jgi:signal transduction histidine kinase
MAAVTGLVLVWRRFAIASREREAMVEHLAQREQIARELHDELLQGVQGLVFGVEAVAYELSEFELARQRLDASVTQARSIIAEARGRMCDFRNCGQFETFAELLAETASQVLPESTLDVHVTVEGSPQPINAVAFGELRWIVGEALCNIEQHANAGRVAIELGFRRHALVIQITDDGNGMGQAAVDRSSREGHFGLPAMHARVRRIGARLAIESRPGSGTSLQITVPGRRAFARGSRWTI